MSCCGGGLGYVILLDVMNYGFWEKFVYVFCIILISRKMECVDYLVIIDVDFNFLIYVKVGVLYY